MGPTRSRLENGARRVLGVLATVAVVFAAAASDAQVRGTIVGPGATSYPIAVSPLEGPDGEGEDGRLFATVLARDLELSGIFRVLDRATYLEGATPANAEAIDFGQWSTIGAQALVKGSLTREDDGVVVEARLFDVVERRQIGGKRYRGNTADLRRIAHRFADEIMLVLTGERGPFASRIAFASRRKTPLKEIFTMDVDGGDLRQATNENSIALAPSWSPDGTSLLFTSFRGGNPSLYEINASRQRTLISSRPGLNLGGRWSPGGKAIAVALENGGNTDIALIDPSGKLIHFVTKERAIDVSPSWSPDGRQLVFCSDRGGGPQIYVVDANGGNERRITFQGNYNTSPAWSPKGDKIAYASRVSGRFQIFVTDLDGRNVTRVTGSSGDNEDPTWSPDGRYLAFSSTRDGRGAIFLSDVGGKHQFRLTPPGGDDSTPSWSRWLE